MAKSRGTTGMVSLPNRIEPVSFLEIPAGFCSKAEKELLESIINNEKPEKFSLNDLHILKNYAELLLIKKEAKQDLDKNGLLLTDDNGKRYKNPGHTIYSDCISKLSTLATRLQLSPSSRNRAGSSAPPPRDSPKESKLSKLINKTKNINDFMVN